MNGLGEVDGSPIDISANKNDNIHTRRNPIGFPSRIKGFGNFLTPTIVYGQFVTAHPDDCWQVNVI
jgi:hypothetical protein